MRAAPLAGGGFVVLLAVGAAGLGRLLGLLGPTSDKVVWTLRECSALVPGLRPTRGASAAWAPGPIIYYLSFVLNWILLHTQRYEVYARLPIIQEVLLYDAQGFSYCVRVVDKGIGRKLRLPFVKGIHF